MEKRLDMATRKSLLKSFRDDYLKANRKEKTRLLDDYIEHTKHNRKYIIGELRSSKVVHKLIKPKKVREPFYGKDVIKLVEELYEIFDRSCGQRLKEQIKLEADQLIERGELKATPDQRNQLHQMSASTIDRRLASYKKDQIHKAHCTTKTGNFLKSKIAQRLTWSTTELGHEEIDLVAHNGGNPHGEFVNSLSVTDIASQWWEGEAVMGKSDAVVNTAIKTIRIRIPFDLLGLDSDNGSEFINHLMYKYCKAEGIEFTRGRANHKNDNAYVEQKNWTHVRKMLGNNRFDTTAELEILNHLYRNEYRLYKNFFQVNYKLETKEFVHNKRKRRYEKHLKTPYQRVLESSNIPEENKQKLQALKQSLNPAELKRRIDKTLAILQLVHSKKIDLRSMLTALKNNQQRKEVI
jgi:hypothetical protein